MLHILLTFDYELFFNKSYFSEKEVLIDTTALIVKSLDRMKIKGTFFVDTPCLLKYEELGLDDFPLMVERQINGLLDDGHDIQLHFHPSWFTANYIDNEWNFDQKSYSLDRFENPSELLVRSKLKLDSLVGNKSYYKCCAFRAGGFCLTPEIEVLSTLYELGIRLDSSVCCGVKMESTAQTFDWTDLNYVGQWRYDPSSGVRSQSISNNYMIEIPVGTYSHIPTKWWLTRCQPRLKYPPLMGMPSPVERENKTDRFTTILNRVKSSFTTPILFVMDNLHANALFFLGEYYLKASRYKNEDIYICALAHPKFSSPECVENMCDFISQIGSLSEEVDFITFRDAYNQLIDIEG